jgi:hypothetical protein
MRGLTILVVLLSLAVVGCGGGANSGVSPREQAMSVTYEGSYQVKGMDGERVQGVGIYSNGSFRVVLEGVPRVIIHNEQSGENWLINLAQKNYQSISYDDAVSKAGFMPHLYMKGYLELESYWSGSELLWDTEGGTIRAYLDGPEYLPSLWEAETGGRTTKSFAWEYRRVGDVSFENFELPEGLTPQA